MGQGLGGWDGGFWEGGVWQFIRGVPSTAKNS